MIGRKSVPFGTLSEKPGRVLRLIQFNDLLVPCGLTKDKIFARFQPAWDWIVDGFRAPGRC
jgi:hypothetical protein